MPTGQKGTKPMARVGLCMIVRNETHVIERCLSTLRGLIDHWTVVDTGSSDDTREKVARALAGIPGSLHDREWRNFGHNRSEALALARPHADYSFVIDADETLEVPAGFRWPALLADQYRLLHANGSNRYWRTSLVCNRLAWRYVGVLHEYVEAQGAGPAVNLSGPVVWGYFDGGRSIGLSTAEKYARDARTLEAALVDEPDNSRYQFYLAQSYRDSGQTGRAIEAYLKRATMGGWEEEVWYALFQAAALQVQAGAPADVVIAAYLRAHEARPTRAEALCDLARYLRLRERHALAHVFAARAKDIPRPADILFLADDVYTWRSLDEYAVSAYWVGAFAESADACRRLLAASTTPVDQRARIMENLRFAESRLNRRSA
jgi:glycosyltransferase involved in cell wall biosynthesis